MKFTKLALTLIATTVLFCGCAKDTDVVLKINDKEITRAEFNEDFNKIKNAQLKNAPKELQKENSYATLAIKDRFVNDTIVRILLTEEFEKRKINASEDEIKAKKEKLIAQIGSVEQFNNLLKENNISNERLNSDMAMEVKIDKFVNLLNKNKVTSSDVEKYYKQNKEQFSAPERVKASHILIDTNVESLKRKLTEQDKDAKLSTAEIEKQTKELATSNEELIKDIRKKAVANPKNFAKLATEYSQDPGTAKKGGDLGYFTKTTMVKEFSDMAFSQKVGTISPFVKAEFGSHIIYVKDKTAKGVQSFSEVKNDLTAFLKRKSDIEFLQNYINGLKTSAKIEYLDESLKPENLRKQIENALPKQKQMEQRFGAPKSKLKTLDKVDKQTK